MKTGNFGCLFGVFTEDYIDQIKKDANSKVKNEQVVCTNYPVKQKVKFKRNGKIYPRKVR